MSNQITRRNFFNLAKLFILFILTSCSKAVNNIHIVFPNTFIPVAIKSLFPKSWIKANIDYEQIKSDRFFSKFKNNNILLINDGWIGRVDLSEFRRFSPNFLNKLDIKARKLLDSYDPNNKEKLFPIGVTPYVLVFKKNNLMKMTENRSWDVLIDPYLKGKIILPESPRVISSISEKISKANSLNKLLAQDPIYDDRNALNWLINSDKIFAVLPLTICQKFLKFDSRLTLCFPDEGVPLMWYFLLFKFDFDYGYLFEWIKSLENSKNVNKLFLEGWYLPWQGKNIEITYTDNYLSLGLNRPSEICWRNSWSFPPLIESENKKLENLFSNTLIP